MEGYLNNNHAPEHWTDVMRSYRKLLHEHHDLLLDCQHRFAPPAARNLAKTIPARMWEHAIQNLLDTCKLLSPRCPEGLEYMCSFIFIAYHMIALLLETVPALELHWLEQLGHLANWRATIEPIHSEERKTWLSISESWYSRAVDLCPSIGRLYHHHAALVRSRSLQQLYYYGKCLICVEIFPKARQSLHEITALAELDMKTFDQMFVGLHGAIMRKEMGSRISEQQSAYLTKLRQHIQHASDVWRRDGTYTAIANTFGWFDYGQYLNPLRRMLLYRSKQRKDTESQVREDDTQPPLGVHQLKPLVFEKQLQRHAEGAVDQTEPRISERIARACLRDLPRDDTFRLAASLANNTFVTILDHIGNMNVLPYVHVTLAFYRTIALIDSASHLLDESPWLSLVRFLNALFKTAHQRTGWADGNESFRQPLFPTSEANGESVRLPEDYEMRGLLWGKEYFPPHWFDHRLEDEEGSRCIERESTNIERTWRVLRLGYELAKVS